MGQSRPYLAPVARRVFYRLYLVMDIFSRMKSVGWGSTTMKSSAASSTPDQQGLGLRHRIRRDQLVPALG